MEHLIIKIAFWMVTLSITLSGYPTVSSGNPIRENDHNIDFLQKEVNCSSDSSFYAPENVKPECITAALECVKEELEGTVKAECNDTNGRIDQALEILHIKIDQRKENSPEKNIYNDCACERWPVAPFSTFLEKYKRLLEQEKSVASG